MLKRVPNVRFVMAGSGDMMNHVIRRVARLGIADRFHFTGFLKGDDEFYAEWLATSEQYVECLRENVLIDEQAVTSLLYGIA